MAPPLRERAEQYVDDLRSQAPVAFDRTQIIEAYEAGYTAALKPEPADEPQDEPLPDAHAEQFASRWKAVGRPLNRESLTSIYREYVPDQENEQIEWAYDDRHELYFTDGSWALITFKGRQSGYIQVGGLEDAEAHWDQQRAS